MGLCVVVCGGCGLWWGLVTAGVDLNGVVHAVLFGGGLGGFGEGGGRVVVCVGWVCVLVESCVGVWGGCGLQWSLVTAVMDLGLFSFFRLPLSA